mmetsp:Transcript_4586/g.14716  ORF Transcript_4586/g.14716 Transcript_4586/m.14716 type:complete len:303 (+) Transcript_4586:1035-1943(+)
MVIRRRAALERGVPEGRRPGHLLALRLGRQRGELQGRQVLAERARLLALRDSRGGHGARAVLAEPGLGEGDRPQLRRLQQLLADARVAEGRRGGVLEAERRPGRRQGLQRVRPRLPRRLGAGDQLLRLRRLPPAGGGWHQLRLAHRRGALCAAQRPEAPAGQVAPRLPEPPHLRACGGVQRHHRGQQQRLRPLQQGLARKARLGRGHGSGHPRLREAGQGRGGTSRGARRRAARGGLGRVTGRRAAIRAADCRAPAHMGACGPLRAAEAAQPGIGICNFCLPLLSGLVFWREQRIARGACSG